MPPVTPHARAVAIDWMAQVVHAFCGDDSPRIFADVASSADMIVFFHATRLLERFLTTRPELDRSQLQGVAAATLLIAYKVHCVFAPRSGEIARLACIQHDELLQHERAVFVATSGCLWDETVVDYLHELASASSTRTRDRALLLCERAVLHGCAQDSDCASQCVSDAKKQLARFRGESYPHLIASYERRNMELPVSRRSKRGRSAVEVSCDVRV